MDHSVTAYIRRMSVQKALLVLREWEDEEKRPVYVTEELLKILREKVQSEEIDSK